MSEQQPNPEAAPELPLVPGNDLVGHFIKLAPGQPYEITHGPTRAEEPSYRVFSSPETKGSYRIAPGCSVDRSPPMPAGQTLGQTVIEESWEHLDEATKIGASVAAGYGSFSVNLDTEAVRSLRTEDASYYALRSSFFPIWSVYVDQPPALTIEQLYDAMGLSGPARERILKWHEGQPQAGEAPPLLEFDGAYRRLYQRLFTRLGTHFIKRVWVGGKATVTATVSRSSNLSKSDIRRALAASYTGLASANGNEELAETRQDLLSNSEISVFGRGGDESKLAQLSSLDHEAYNAWIATITSNPKVIEFEVVGIWNLIDNLAVSETIKRAYEMETGFVPLSAIVGWGSRVLFVRGHHYIGYDFEEGRLNPDTYAPIQHVLDLRKYTGGEMPSITASTLSSPEQRLYFFYQDKVIAIDLAKSKFSETGQDEIVIADGFPAPVREVFPGVPFTTIDAAFHWLDGSLYMFCGTEYVRFDTEANRIDPGYPRPIVGNWSGVLFDTIDAAVVFDNSTLYLFRKDEVTAYSMTAFRAEPGYPKKLATSYVEDLELLGRSITSNVQPASAPTTADYSAAFSLTK